MYLFRKNQTYLKYIVKYFFSKQTLGLLPLAKLEIKAINIIYCLTLIYVSY